MDKHSVSVKDKIMQKVRFDEDCWIWLGATRKEGKFPMMTINKKHYRVREIALNLFSGVDIPSSMDIKENCKRSLCINPDHLFLSFRSGIPNLKNRNERSKRDIQERLWEKANVCGENECWNWKASLDGKGYGQLNIHKRMKRAHRLIYESIYGKIPKGMEICHHCDNPKCVNPKHLFSGTHKDNMQDMSKKGRSRKKIWANT